MRALVLALALVSGLAGGGSPPAVDPEVAAPPADAHPAEVFVAANGAYQAGAYDQAVALYQSLIERGVESGHLYYDLGNALLRNGELGRAVAAYRRAERYLPRDQDLKANLAFARKSAKDALAPPSPPPLLETMFFWHYGLSRGELLKATVVLNLLFWSLLSWRLFRGPSEAVRWSAVVVAVLLVATGGSLAAHLAFPDRTAIIVPQEVRAHSGTSEDSVVRFHLHAGSEVRLVERRDDWLRIALPDGQQGWLPAGQAEVVAR